MTPTSPRYPFVDRAGRVQHRHAVGQGEATAGADLGFGAGGQLKREAGADQPGLTRLDVEVDSGVEIQTGVGGMGPDGQRRG